jgi:glycosyltransferase involved in cell wall biosynthesis
MNELAIVIPAYKATYFHKALQSLADQTVKNFTVYVGDDNSPYNLESITEKFSDQLDIRYHRFESNIGSKNLVNQWKRCIELTREEKWLWLFSDDDLADKQCVENFFILIESKRKDFDIYRFNTCVIDINDTITSESPQGPMEETSEEMAFNLLLGRRGNSMPDHIFSRVIYNEMGGFVVTEYAQGADWGTSILFSKNRGISIIPNSMVYWRMSETNISGKASSEKNEMIFGYLQFVRWLLKHLNYLVNANSNISYVMIKQAARTNLKSVLINHYKGISFKSFFPVLGVMKKELGISYKEALKDIYVIIKHTRTK